MNRIERRALFNATKKMDVDYLDQPPFKGRISQLAVGGNKKKAKAVDEFSKARIKKQGGYIPSASKLYHPTLSSYDFNWGL